MQTLRREMSRGGQSVRRAEVFFVLDVEGEDIFEVRRFGDEHRVGFEVELFGRAVEDGRSRLLVVWSLLRSFEGFGLLLVCFLALAHLFDHASLHLHCSRDGFHRSLRF